MADDELPGQMAAEPNAESPEVPSLSLDFPEPGTAEYRELTLDGMRSSLRAWNRFRAILVKETPPDYGMNDQRLEELMWLHAGSVLGNLAELSRPAQTGNGLASEPHLPELLSFVADAIRQSLDRHPPRVFREAEGNRKGPKERNCLAFAKHYEDLTRETALDGTRLLPDDNAIATICAAYNLDSEAYRKAEKSLDEADFVICHWWHPGAFRWQLLSTPPEKRLAHGQDQIQKAGHDYQWVRADRLTDKPRRRGK